MHRLTIKTHKKREIVDITKQLEAILWKQYGDKTGVCHLSLLHTTAALTTADLDPGTDLDMLDAFEHLIPKLEYRHPHNPTHVSDHILSALIGTSLTLMLDRGLLLLGTWQRVVLIELDGPRERELVLAFVEAA
jgi:secondary thiamine-phosphate synthase enzyme